MDGMELREAIQGMDVRPIRETRPSGFSFHPSTVPNSTLSAYVPGAVALTYAQCALFPQIVLLVIRMDTTEARLAAVLSQTRLQCLLDSFKGRLGWQDGRFTVVQPR